MLINATNSQMKSEDFQGKLPKVTVVVTNQERKPYFGPRLEELGDLRAVTFGSKLGGSDSGGQAPGPFSLP